MKIRAREFLDNKSTNDKLTILLQPEYKQLFLKFIELLGDFHLPEYKPDGNYKSNSSALDDYKKRCSKIKRQREKTYDLYLGYLHMQGMDINISELKYSVKLYNKRIDLTDS